MTDLTTLPNVVATVLLDKADPCYGYGIEQGESGFRWLWFEPGEQEPTGGSPRYPSLIEALRSVHDDALEALMQPDADRLAQEAMAQAARLAHEQQGQEGAGGG